MTLTYIKLTNKKQNKQKQHTGGKVLLLIDIEGHHPSSLLGVDLPVGLR